MRNQLQLNQLPLKIRETNHVSLSMSMKKRKPLRTNCFNEFSHKVKKLKKKRVRVELGSWKKWGKN